MRTRIVDKYNIRQFCIAQHQKTIIIKGSRQQFIAPHKNCFSWTKTVVFYRMRNVVFALIKIASIPVKFLCIRLSNSATYSIQDQK